MSSNTPSRLPTLNRAAASNTSRTPVVLKKDNTPSCSQRPGITPVARKPLSSVNVSGTSSIKTSTTLKRHTVSSSDSRTAVPAKRPKAPDTPAAENFEHKYEESIAEQERLNEKIASLEKQVENLQENIALKTREVNEKNDKVLELSTEVITASARLAASASQLQLLEAQQKATAALYQTALREIEELQKQSAQMEQMAMEAEVSRKQEMLVSNDRIRLLLNEVVDLRGRIRVVIRLRPFLPEDGPSTSVAHFGFPDLRSISVKSNNKSSTYQFQNVFGCNAGQQTIFDELKELVESVLHGYNVSIIAYGQTGSGKTFTMQGGDGEHAGIIPRAIEFMFETKKNLKNLEWQYDYSASFLEVYNDEVFDLLADDKTKLKVTVGSGQVEIPSLKSFCLNSPEDLYELLAISDKNRSTASTKMNSNSSRSHAVFLLKVTATNTMTNQSFSSLLSMVDLAGSERAKESEVEGERFKEMTHINKALSNLQNVIRALLKKEQHVPYRNSKLTLLLQECLGKGNSKTLMIVNLRPSASHISETKRSLEFAQNTSKTTIGAALKSETH
ncbi:hypothetical protein L596_003534 [Steinernema carpocapsae]|uniref:Kinesin motor domain-containing protein n=1 Tax=Steinernema carpocapsae TaxID=34508 RepID=A0A4U8USX3_STECR|nr:hypothetical protein L596_003534 [Steinernema carpocapsae]